MPSFTFRLLPLCGCALAACTADFGQFDFSGLSSVRDAGADASTAANGGSGARGSGGRSSGDGGANSGGRPSGGSTGAGGSARDSGNAPDADVGLRDAAADTGAVTDGRAPDANVTGPDAAPAEASVADGNASDAGGDASASACDVRYGAADGYTLCSSTPTSCTFYVFTRGSNCEALCASLSGSCIDAANNQGAQPCVIGNPSDTCQTARDDTICTCSSP